MDIAVHKAGAGAEAVASGIAASAAARAGTLMGMAVGQAPSPVSVLSDAAAELGLMACETSPDEAGLEEFEQDRDVDEERRERARQYKELMDKEPRKVHRLEALKDFLDSRHQRRDARREMFRFFSNPTDLYVALGYILATVETESASVAASDQAAGSAAAPDRATLASEIRWLMDDLEESHGPRISAGLVGGLHGREYADLGDSQTLGEFYGRTVCDFATVNEVFAHVQARYGSDGFERAMDFLFGALGADMASHRPSMETTHLEYVQRNLGRVRLMQNVYLHCEALLRRWEDLHGVSRYDLTPLSLVGHLMELRQTTYLGAMHIDAIAARAGAPDIEHEVLFLQEMLAMARALPSQLFDGDEGRMRLLDAVQQALDKAVEREDAYLASRA